KPTELISLRYFGCGASWNRTSDTRIFSPLLYRLSYGTNKGVVCGASWNRTSDTRIFSPLLYRLSYGTVCDITPLGLLRCKCSLFFHNLKLLSPIFSN